MAGLESPIAAGLEGKKPGDSSARMTAKVLSYGFATTGIVLGFLITYVSFFWSLFPFGGGSIIYCQFFFTWGSVFYAFGVLEGLVNRRIARTFRSVSKNSLLADAFIRGPTALAISFWFTWFMAIPVSGMAIPALPPANPFFEVDVPVLFVFLTTPWNGLAAMIITRWHFGLSGEETVDTTSTLGMT